MVIYVNSDGTIREGHNTFEVRRILVYLSKTSSMMHFDALDVPRFNSGRENWSFHGYRKFLRGQG